MRRRPAALAALALGLSLLPGAVCARTPTARFLLDRAREYPQADGYLGFLRQAVADLRDQHGPDRKPVIRGEEDYPWPEGAHRYLPSVFKALVQRGLAPADFYDVIDGLSMYATGSPTVESARYLVEARGIDQLTAHLRRYHYQWREDPTRMLTAAADAGLGPEGRRELAVFLASSGVTHRPQHLPEFGVNWSLLGPQGSNTAPFMALHEALPQDQRAAFVREATPFVQVYMGEDLVRLAPAFATLLTDLPSAEAATACRALAARAVRPRFRWLAQSRSLSHLGRIWAHEAVPAGKVRLLTSAILPWFHGRDDSYRDQREGELRSLLDAAHRKGLPAATVRALSHVVQRQQRPAPTLP